MNSVYLLLLVALVSAKKHQLSLRDDSRRNIILTRFGFAPGGTLDVVLSNFTVPDKILAHVDSGENADKMGVIGFSFSRGNSIAAGVGSNPRVCQLQQTDQGFDALFFVADLPNKRLKVFRSGAGAHMKLCRANERCAEQQPTLVAPPVADDNTNRTKRDTLFGRIKNLFTGGDGQIEYQDYLPLTVNDNLYSGNFSIQFDEELQGMYHFIFHNCFNYRAHGYSDRVAVDFVADMDERNLGSFLSAGDIPKPRLFLYISLIFFVIGAMWIRILCLSPRENVYSVHVIMAVLVFLKVFSLFFHGLNYYFVSVYGHQKEIWAFVYYITHLLKGALLFGTIILIGTGYTFFKNFLTERDRKVFMVVLPLQIIDNIALVILEESEFGAQGRQMWYEMFVLLDLLCCFLVFFPIIWSMHHLVDGARSDGKAAFNLTKLRLFRHFYLLVIGYIYFTRILKVLLMAFLPFNQEWVNDAMVELSTLVFFVLVGIKFRPQRSNPYLKLQQEDSGDEECALTRNGLLEGVVNRSRDIGDVPGAIGGVDSDSDDDEVMKRRIDGLEKTLL